MKHIDPIANRTVLCVSHGTRDAQEEEKESKQDGHFEIGMTNETN